MYELFVLGELMDSPLHGYLLRDIVNLAIGPVRQMSWSALYPLMHGLEEEGYVELMPDEGATSGRPRKVYRITESGKAEFFRLLLKPEEYTPDYPDIFNIKLVNFDQINSQQQLDILRHYRGYVQYILDHHTKSQQMIVQRSEIPDQERAYIQQVITHRIAIAKADAAWVDDTIVRLLKN